MRNVKVLIFEGSCTNICTKKHLVVHMSVGPAHMKIRTLTLCIMTARAAKGCVTLCKRQFCRLSQENFLFAFLRSSTAILRIVLLFFTSFSFLLGRSITGIMLPVDEELARFLAAFLLKLRGG